MITSLKKTQNKTHDYQFEKKLKIRHMITSLKKKTQNKTHDYQFEKKNQNRTHDYQSKKYSK